MPRVATLLGAALGAIVAALLVLVFNSTQLASGEVLNREAAFGAVGAGTLIGAWLGYWAAGGYVPTSQQRETSARPLGKWLP